MRTILPLWLLSQLHACSGALLVTPQPNIAQATRTVTPTPTRIDPREILAIVSNKEKAVLVIQSRKLQHHIFLFSFPNKLTLDNC